jgi:transcriptional regulator with XRE-family HTH domain
MLDPVDVYSEVFDPYEPRKPPVPARISDDLADVMTDLRHGMAHYKAGRTTEAMWWWQFSYFSNWGSTASATLRALQSLVAHVRLNQPLEELDGLDTDQDLSEDALAEAAGKVMAEEIGVRWGCARSSSPGPTGVEAERRVQLVRVHVRRGGRRLAVPLQRPGVAVQRRNADVRDRVAPGPAEPLHAQRPRVTPRSPRRQQEVHPPEPDRLADDGSRVAVGRLDEVGGDLLPAYALDTDRVEVDAGQAELVSGEGDPLGAVVGDCVRHGHTVTAARLRSVVTEELHAGVYQPEVAAVSVQYNSSTPSPLNWRYSGNQLKRWRTKANITREELAAAANYSPDTIKSMEQGVRMPTPRVLDAADELCHAEGLLSAAKDYLRREKFPARAQDFMVYEREAINRLVVRSRADPGLLQTETVCTGTDRQPLSAPR